MISQIFFPYSLKLLNFLCPYRGRHFFLLCSIVMEFIRIIWMSVSIDFNVNTQQLIRENRRKKEISGINR